MAVPLGVLVVSSNEGVLNPLREVLKQLGVSSDVARTCGHARAVMERANPPQVVFSDAVLPDGTCEEVIEFAVRSAAPTRVIVISEGIDYELYVDALEAGAADFIMPPFSPADVAFIMCTATESKTHPFHEAA